MNKDYNENEDSIVIVFFNIIIHLTDKFINKITNHTF